MFLSLRSKLNTILIAFTLMVIISVGVTFWGLETQRQNASIIDYAGRQRMLLQLMARMVNLNDGANLTTMAANLDEAEQIFNQTLSALRTGGIITSELGNKIKIPATRNPQTLAEIDNLETSWSNFQQLLHSFGSNPPTEENNALRLGELDTLVQSMVSKIDRIVSLYSLDAAHQLNLVRNTQLVFLLAAISLLVVGAYVIHQDILKPLDQFKLATVQLQNNRMDQALATTTTVEFNQLVDAFEKMRINLKSTQQELLHLNESLEKRVVQRTAELETLYEVSREITAQLDIHKVLSSITDKAKILLAADVASLCLLESDLQWLHLEAISGSDQAQINAAMDLDNQFVVSVLNEKVAVKCDQCKFHSACQILAEPYRTSHIVAPLKMGERIIGALCVGSQKENFFTAEDQNIMTKLANSAAVALENARIYAQLEKVSVLEERNRIAAEIHDGLGQTLGYLGLMLDQSMDLLGEDKKEQAQERLSISRSKINAASQEMRAALNQLKNENPIDNQVGKILEKEILEMVAQYSIPIQFQDQCSNPTFCSQDVIEQITKIAREAIVNAIKHAQASQIEVTLSSEDTCCQLLIADNGIGMAQPGAKKDGHFGLQIMQARAAHMNGTLEIESIPQQGTKIILKWKKEEGGK